MVLSISNEMSTVAEPVEDGAHVRAWNEDPAGYARTVTGFLERIGRDR